MAFIIKPVPQTLVLGAGGLPASLFSTGAICAVELIGRAGQFRIVYLCSGSGPPGFLWMGGMRPPRLVSKMIEYDCERLMPLTNTKLAVVRSILLAKLEGKPLTMGLRDTTMLGYRIQKHCPEWPLAVRTIATCGDNEIVFGAEGVYEYCPGENRRIISDVAAPVGIGVRATATVPFHMTPVNYMGRILQDGALNEHGHCPTTLAALHDGVKVEDIIAFVPDKGDEPKQKLLMNIGRHLAGNHQKELEQHAALMVKPTAANTRSLDFNISKERKAELILAGFCAMLRGLNSADLLDRVDIEKVIAKTATLDGLYEWLEQRESSDGLCV